MNRLNNFKSLNLLLGWLVFAISLVVYLLTMEPTTSLWDCSEFIATSYKMEVGHPPGAPLFMMINRFFTIFAPDITQVAVMVNIASCLASALTILFLFWTVSHLGKRLLRTEENELSVTQLWTVMGAALVGSLAYAFTDTFWFSAIEGEVYAQSSLFTAMVFWAILKWENVAGKPYSNKWLVLIAYLMGLSIGVHILNLLAIPALVFVYYFKMYPNPGKWGWMKATVASVAILAFVLFLIIPKTVEVGALFDRLFVNTFGLPVNSGLLFSFLFILGLLAFGAVYFQRKGKVIMNTIALCTLVMVLGYGTYASVVIRAEVNPPMNSNDPSDPYQLLYLLNREQYGSPPLFSGQYYSSPVIEVKEKTYYRLDENGKYVPYQTGGKAIYDSRFTTVFPRMWDSQSSLQREYQRWGQVKGRNIPYGDRVINMPTFGENLTYFFSYQLNFMYWRYFLWNFVGRQNDIQSQGEIVYGNWLSGIKPIDALYLGPQDNLPEPLKNNRGRNRYYFLPFLLGMIGLFYQLRKDPRNFVVVMWLFFMTGIAIILYLNQPPLQPRERDYAFAGSFYAFAIWIGLGVAAVHSWLGKIRQLKNKKAGALVATALCMSVPVILIAENWDDHTRAHRYVARDFGYNYLESTLPNSIIVPYGDNDTFPLWYNQEVEEVRLDVRVMNSSYIQSDWYIEQMRIKSNASDPVPFMIPMSKIVTRDYFPMTQENIPGYTPLKTVLEFFKSEDPRTRVQLTTGETTDYIPTRRISIPVDKEKVLRNGIVAQKDSSLIVDTMYIDLKGDYMLKSHLAIYDMIATNDWERPIYISQPYPTANDLGLRNYLQLDGFSYRLVPIYTDGDYYETGHIDTEYLYDKMMNVFRYGNVKDPRVNNDYFVRYTFSAAKVLTNFGRLARKLAEQGEPERALEVLARAMEEVPFSRIGYSYPEVGSIVEGYYAAGAPDQGNVYFDSFIQQIKDHFRYFSQFKGRRAAQVSDEVREQMMYMYNMYVLAARYGQTSRADDLEQYLRALDVIE